MCSDSLTLGKGGPRVPFESKEMLKPHPQGFFFIKWGTEKLASLLVLLKGSKSHILVFLRASIFFAVKVSLIRLCVNRYLSGPGCSKAG